MTLSTARRLGCSEYVVSSWKSTARARTSPPAAPSSRSSAGSPRLPPTRTSMPAALANSPTSVVTVLLPFVPVMPTTRPPASRAKSSMSPTRSRPCAARLAEQWLGERHAGRHDDLVRTVEHAPGSKPPSAVAASRHQAAQLREAGRSSRVSVTTHGDGPAPRDVARRPRRCGRVPRSRCDGMRSRLCCISGASSVASPNSTSMK